MSNKLKPLLTSIEDAIVMKTKQGRSQEALMKLLFEKIGITKKELNAIRKPFIEYSKAKAKKYMAIIKKEKTDFKRILSNSIYYPHFTLQPQGEGIPEIPADVFIPFEGGVQHGGILHAEGDGDGYITQRWGGNADHYSRLDVAFTFDFTPQIATHFTFESVVLAVAPYYIIAQDDWTNSKEASINITLNMILEQDIPQPFGGPSHVTTKMDTINLFNLGDDNIEQTGKIIAQKPVKIEHVFLHQQIPVRIIISMTCIIMGKGEGSRAFVNFSNPAGGIVCTGLAVKPG